MEAYATVEDLEGRWRALDESERARARTQLEDASAFIAAQLRRYRVTVDPADEVQSQNLKSVCCSVTRRSLAQSFAGDSTGSQYTGQTVTAGVFSQTYTYANPTGDMYLTVAEKRLLGIGRALVAQVMPYTERLDGA